MTTTARSPVVAGRRTERPHVLQLLHSRPGELGGTEKHFWKLVESLVEEFDVSILQPGGDGFLLTNLWDLGDEGRVRQELSVPGQVSTRPTVDDPGAALALRTALDMFHFDAVHIQNIVQHSLAPLDVLAAFSGPVSCSVRDLYLACPHHWLLYRNRQSCGVPDDLSVCARCLPETRGLDVGYLQSFRETVAARLDVVDHWVFASQSAVDYFLRAYDVAPDRIAVIEHGAIIEHRRTRTVDRARIFDEPLRLAFVGIGWAKKGLPVVNELAEHFAGTSVEIHHFGEVREPTSPCVYQHGSYDNAVLPELLHRAGIQIVLLPGPFVETFGHVMTEALLAGLPVIGHRHGALGERIRRHDVGWTVDPSDAVGIRDLIGQLDACRLEVLRATERAVDVEVRTVDATRDRYAALYRRTDADEAPPRTRRSGEPVSEIERLQRELAAMAARNRQLEQQLVARNRAAPEASQERPSAPSLASAAANRPPGALRRRAQVLAHHVRRTRSVIDRRGLVPTGRAVARRVLRRAGLRVGR